MMQTAYLKKLGMVSYRYLIYEDGVFRALGYSFSNFIYNAYNKTLSIAAKDYKNIDEIVFDF